MRIRLVVALVTALSLVAAPAAAQGPPDSAGPPGDRPAQAEQATARGSSAQDAGERRVDDEHRAEQSGQRDERADAGAANAPWRADDAGDEDEGDHDLNTAAEGEATSQDAREGGRDFGLDRAQERVDERTPEHAMARQALEHTREQGDNGDGEDNGDNGNGDGDGDSNGEDNETADTDEAGVAQAGAAGGAVEALLQALDNAAEAALDTLGTVLERVSALFGTGADEDPEETD